jgi:hypothetical protein
LSPRPQPDRPAGGRSRFDVHAFDPPLASQMNTQLSSDVFTLRTLATFAAGVHLTIGGAVFSLALAVIFGAYRARVCDEWRRSSRS